MFDAIVIGARCAGASTAMLLARKGHRVLVVDRSTFPSDVISTHFVWPHGTSYLNRWGLLERVLPSTPTHNVLQLVAEDIPLTGIISPELVRRYFQQLHGDDSGVVGFYTSTRRHVLDKHLVDAAVEAGAEVREGFVVEELLSEGGRVVGIRGRTQQGTRVEERARIIVGADGRNSFVAQTLKLPKLDERPKCTFAYWSYFSGLAVEHAQVYRRGRLAFVLAPTSFGQTLVLVFGPSEWGAEFRRDIAGNFQRAADFVNPEKGELLRTQGRREERFYGTLDQAGFLRPLHGPGWVLVGDAECFKDQCTAIGMTHAFRDAELASTALDGWLSGRQPLQEAMLYYENRRRSPSAAAYYDYVCTTAEMRHLSQEELQLFALLRDNPEAIQRFFATHVDISPVSEFFEPAHLASLQEAAKGRLREYAIFDNLEATSRKYQQNLFAA